MMGGAGSLQATTGYKRGSKHVRRLLPLEPGDRSFHKHPRRRPATKAKLHILVQRVQIRRRQVAAAQTHLGQALDFNFRLGRMSGKKETKEKKKKSVALPTKKVLHAVARLLASKLACRSSNCDMLLVQTSCCAPSALLLDARPGLLPR